MMDRKSFLAMGLSRLIFFLVMLTTKENSCAFAIDARCALVINNTLTSPGYPNSYPNNMFCNYSIPIPHGMAMEVYFHDFELLLNYLFLRACERTFDHLMITNENSQSFGVYCGKRTGRAVIVTGANAKIEFISYNNYYNQKRGFLISFTAVLHGNETSPEEFRECGFVVNNSLTSPGYPNNYPSNIHCVYAIPIPHTMSSMQIYFSDFIVEDGPCMFDYMKITNEKNKTFGFGFYCGPWWTGRQERVTGEYVIITFHSDLSVQKRGFKLLFTGEPIALPKVALKTPIVTAQPGYLLDEFPCTATGSLPVYTAIIWNSTIVYNTTYNPWFFVPGEGNYTCVATNKYGTDVKHFSVIFPDCGPQCSHDFEWGYQNIFSCMNITSGLYIITCVPRTTNSLRLPSANITFLPDGIFDNLTDLQGLDLSSNSITVLPKGVFAKLPDLYRLILSWNAITSLPDGIFDTQRELMFLSLEFNNIQNLTEDIFSPLRELAKLNLSSNNIQHLPANLLKHSTMIGFVDLSYNKIEYIPKDFFCCFPLLELISLQNNRITLLSSEVFVGCRSLRYILFAANQLENIPHRAFFISNPIGGSIRDILMLSDNPITSIEPEAFKLHQVDRTILIVYLLRTKLKIFSMEYFIGLSGLHSQLITKNRTISKMKYYGERNCTIYLKAIDSDEDAIVEYHPTKTPPPANIFVAGILAMGFRVLPHENPYFVKLRPCPVGTFYNSSSRGRTQGCVQCPPGGFYSDDVGYVATSCKKCPTGSFVAFDKAPGTRPEDCKTCPTGTDTDLFAGYRACRCLKGFYRTHMFEDCLKCGQGGLECKDEYAYLKPGYWWEWRNESHKDLYINFTKNLLASEPALDISQVQYPHSIPTPYRCPRKKSCKVASDGFDSRCEIGYRGPLCDVCSSGFYKQLKTCKQCPSKSWIVGQLVIIVVFLLAIIAVLMWTSRRSTRNGLDNSVVDMFLSKLKIVIGFYQVTNGVLEAFSYINWPDSLEVIGKYSGILQMNVLQIAPAHCLFPGLHVDAFGSLFVMMAINATAIIFSGVAYGVSKVTIVRNQSIEDEEKSTKVSQAKERVYRNLFFVLYVTYLSTCSNTASVLPLACRTLCRDVDEKEESCYKYLKADYSIRCQGPQYHNFLIVAYISSAYIIALPAASFVALWRKRKMILNTDDTKASQDPLHGMEIVTGLRFLFENYKPCSWYWEVVETSRKVILTSGLILVGQDSRSYIGLAWVVAGMYGVVFSWMKPIQDAFENRLMSTSIAVTVLNLGIGAVSRIPAENIPGSIDPYVDAVMFEVLVFGANTLVISLLIVQYAMHLFRYFKEWRKNPQWSLSCCLALLLPLTDLQGDITGIAGTNVLDAQLQTGDFEVSTVIGAVKDSGVIDVTLEEGDDNTAEVQDDSHDNDTKCHQWTQTELVSHSVDDIAVHGAFDETSL